MLNSCCKSGCNFRTTFLLKKIEHLSPLYAVARFNSRQQKYCLIAEQLQCWMGADENAQLLL